MIDDPIVEEIRRVRQAHAARFGFNLKAIVEDFRRQQAESGRTYVRLPPRPPRSITRLKRPLEAVTEARDED